jgi:hypothetical protein
LLIVNRLLPPEVIELAALGDDILKLNKDSASPHPNNLVKESNNNGWAVAES